MNRSIPFVSVIIPVYNASTSLGICLEAAYRSIYPDYEVIVVDDCSSDESVNIAKRFPAQVIELSSQKGPAAARNRGAALAKGDVLMFLDADVVIQPDTICALVDSLNSETAAVLAQYDDRTIFANFASQFKNLWLCYMFLNAPATVSWFWSGCGIIRRDAFLESGCFNEQLRECEDYALGYRLMSQGKAIRLNHQVRVVHHHHRSLWGMLKSDFKRARDNIKILLSESRASDNSFATQHNVLKVITVYITLVSIAAAWIFPPMWLAAVMAGILFGLLNAPFFSYLKEKTTLFFCLKSGLLTFVVYLNMGLGGFVGAAGWIYRHKLRDGKSTLTL